MTDEPDASPQMGINSNTAPYPRELAELVDVCAYRPNWRVFLQDVDRGQASQGLTLVIRTWTVDTYDPETPIAVLHYFPVPPAAYNRRSWQRWLFNQLLLVEQHECMEFFQIDGQRPYAPAHGPGNNPYLILEYGDDVDRRTDFRGEVQDG